MKFSTAIFKTFFLSLCIVANTSFVYAQTAAILPPAKTTFFDQNGKPLTGGKVFSYIPGTTTNKTTWQDSAETIPNTNPVTLDAAGRALILGSGSYQQAVYDRNNNLIWNQVTSSAGSGGSGNVTVGDGNAVGVVLPWSGFVAPSNYAFAYGQELSRTTYSTLLANITLNQSITCISGNATITSVADTSQLNIGAVVEASCVTVGSTIVSKTTNTVTLNNTAIVSTTTNAIFYPWGNGNGVTTFNAPDLRGVVLPGRNNMGGANSSNLTTSFYTDPNALAGRGGSQSNTLLLSNIPSGIISSGSNTITVTAPDGQKFATGTGTNNVTTSAGGSPIVTAPVVDSTTASGVNTITVTSTNGGGIAVSATVAAAGSGYTTGTQLLTVAGGTCTTAPQFNVTVSGGVISAPVLVTAGLCSVIPSNPAGVSGGGGTGGTLTISYSAVPVTTIQPSKTINYIVKVLPDVNLSIARCSNLIDAGTGCTANTGTSGNTIPLLNTANSWSALQTLASVAIAGGSFTGLATPVNPTDATTKAYVDSVATGLNILAQTTLATAAILPNSPTYANGALGVGATLTAGSNTTLTVDGTAAPLNTVVLVKNQVTAANNGIYTVTTAGSGAAAWVLTRATYFDQAAEMKAGSYTLVTAGSTNANSSWVLQTAVATVGTDPVNWVQFSGQAGVVSVGGNQGIVTNAQVTASCNTFTGSLSGCVPSGSGTTAISQLIPTTQTWTTPTALVLQSRATAASLNLTGVNAVKTLGYAAAGDGGEATFKNVGSTAFIDSFITTFSTAAGSGYTNGTYYGVIFSIGSKPFSIGVVTVAGGVITSIDISGTPGNQCAVSDNLTMVANGPTGGSGGSITVTACSTPLGSFSDSAGNHFQITSAPWANVLQFGCKGDWNGTDGSATDNYNCIQAAYWYAGFKSSTSYDSGGFWGGRVDFPQGSYMACGTGAKPLVVVNGVASWGANGTASTIKFCSAWNASTVQLELGDPNWHFACFETTLHHMELRADSGTAYVVHSNCAQDFGGVYESYIFSNGASARPCLHYEKGYGGASKFTIRDLSCTANSASPQIWIGNTDASGLNLGTTTVEMTGLVLGANSSGLPVQSAPGILINGGWITGTFAHCESMPQCLSISVSAASGGYVKYANINGGNGNPSVTCTGVVQFGSGNSVSGNNTLEQIQAAGSCTHVVDNGMAGGSHYNSGIGQPAIFNPSFHSF